MRRVALATCRELPELDPDDRLVVEPLAERGIEAAAAVWDDPAVDWSAFDLVVLRSTWDYAERREAFLDWVRSLPRVLNPASVVAWNTDKERYLPDLRRAGVPLLPTEFVPPGAELDPPGDDFVVKPAISAGGRSSARFSPDRQDDAHGLVARIHAGGRTAMVQPFVGDARETALVYVGGEFSHAVRRHVPLPEAGSRPVLYLEEDLGPATATALDRAVAEAALACAPEPLLYARVDLLGGSVLELEVTEPSLYLAFGEGAAERFATAIAVRL